MLRLFKVAYKKEPKKISLAIFLVVSFTVLHMFSVWQLDLILVNPVWNTQAFIQAVDGNVYSQSPFQCWLWKTTIGEAYDTLFFLNFLSFYGVIAAFTFLLYEILKINEKKR